MTVPGEPASRPPPCPRPVAPAGSGDRPWPRPFPGKFSRSRPTGGGRSRGLCFVGWSNVGDWGKKGPGLGGPTYKLVPGWAREGCPLPRGLGKNRRRRTDERGGAGDFPRVDQKKRPWPHRCTLRGGFFTFSRNSQRLLDTYRIRYSNY